MNLLEKNQVGWMSSMLSLVSLNLSLLYYKLDWQDKQMHGIVLMQQDPIVVEDAQNHKGTACLIYSAR